MRIIAYDRDGHYIAITIIVLLLFGRIHLEKVNLDLFHLARVQSFICLGKDVWL